jgi:membrane-associated protein
VSAITTELGRLSGPLAYALVAALVFGETALFFGFVLPGEIAVVLGGVLASRGRVSLPLLMLVVVAAAIVGPLIGYEVGRRMGSRVVASRFLRRVSGPVERAASTLNARGAAAVLVGRFTAVLRALMPALAGTARMPYRTFAVYNAVSGIVWGVGYCLLGYLAGSAYTVVEREVGTGFAIAIAALVVAALVIWAVRRRRRPEPEPPGTRPRWPRSLRWPMSPRRPMSPRWPMSRRRPRTPRAAATHECGGVGRRVGPREPHDGGSLRSDRHRLGAMNRHFGAVFLARAPSLAPAVATAPVLTSVAGGADIARVR